MYETKETHRVYFPYCRRVRLNLRNSTCDPTSGVPDQMVDNFSESDWCELDVLLHLLLLLILTHVDLFIILSYIIKHVESTPPRTTRTRRHRSRDQIAQQ